MRKGASTHSFLMKLLREQMQVVVAGVVNLAAAFG
jgi:hypothetical protein